MAIHESVQLGYGFSLKNPISDYQVQGCAREGLFKGSFGHWNNTVCTGASRSDATFRPVVWN